MRISDWSSDVCSSDLIDERPFGGTCALRGCDPKKILVGAAESTDRARRFDGKRVRHGSLDIDWPALMSFKRSFTEPVPKAREAGFAEQGIDAYHGRARLARRDQGPLGTAVLEGRHLLLPTHAKTTHHRL